MKRDGFTAFILIMVIFVGMIIDEVPKFLYFLFGNVPESIVLFDTYGRPFIYIFATYLAVKLGLKKDRQKISALFSTRVDPFYSPRIEQVTLTNEQDANVLIGSIDVKLPNGQCFILCDFNNKPFVLKALDTHTFQIEPYSEVYSEITAEALRNATIYLATPRSYYRCPKTKVKGNKHAILPQRHMNHNEVIGPYSKYVLHVKETKESKLKVIQVSKTGLLSGKVKGFNEFKPDISSDEIYNFFDEIGVYSIAVMKAGFFSPVIPRPPKAGKQGKFHLLASKVKTFLRQGIIKRGN
ncbi:hypothetical protein [Pseudoalteromonas sp. Of11M-6]|uniref:hypothetical protein n=1 Tax=Pseudoalteromonas sp. Of11M-6 TaxID=2917754 RepID=UPI001EF4212C|nr:hypothetical protein [Pseudoalteromonas sp. Of11M-6]MCG7551950.1 hypothetical protein [Pseudoalteromonas sp. Of11M-6]